MGWNEEIGKRYSKQSNQKRVGIVILKSDKINIKLKFVTRDKEGHYIMIKQSIQEEYITLIKLFAPNVGASKYIDKYQKT